MGLFDQHTPRKAVVNFMFGMEAKAEVLPPAKEQELTFHDTIPLEEEQLPQARENAAKQRGIILAFFRERFSMNFTPAEVHSMLIGESAQASETNTRFILLSSVRRSITDLTKEGRLIKCSWEERRRGRYGRDNRTWRYDAEFINRLNPQK